MCVCVCVCVYIYMCVCIYIYVCVYIYKTENILSFIQNEIIHFKLSLQGSILNVIYTRFTQKLYSKWASLVAQMVKNPPVMQESQI